MTLANLLKIGQLKEHVTDAGELARLLAAADRGIADAQVQGISPETRFDAAYRKRNEVDYTGADVDETSVSACVDAARKLLKELRRKIA